MATIRMVKADAMSYGLKPSPPTRRSRGSVLVEAAAGVAMLGVVALLLARGSLNAISGRYWTMVQNMSDAYMTYEVALAQRVPMDEVVGGSTLWPLNPTTAQTTVEIGKLPGGTAITGTVHRTRVADTNNLSSASGGGDSSSNPAGMEVWKLQSHIEFMIGSNKYRKSRTVIRSR